MYARNSLASITVEKCFGSGSFVYMVGLYSDIQKYYKEFQHIHHLKQNAINNDFLLDYMRNLYKLF